MLPMIVNSPAAPLLLMLLCLLLLAFLLWRMYWLHSVQPVLQPLQALRQALPKNANTALGDSEWQAIARSCATHEGLQRAWQAYHSQLLQDQQSQWRSLHPAAHWFGQDSLSADLPPLGFTAFLLILLAIFTGLGWWLWSANVDFQHTQQIINALRKPNVGAVGLLFGGILVSRWLLGRRVQATQRIERQTRALAQELDTCFPLVGTQHFLQQALAEQASQQVFNAALLANAIREAMPAQPDHTVLQSLPELLQQQQQSLQIFMQHLQTQQSETHQTLLRDVQNSLKTQELSEAIAKSASALHDFVQMLGYLNRIIPESLKKSGEQLQVQVSKAGEAWQAQLAQPLQQLTQQGEIFAQHLHTAGARFSQRLDAMEHSLNHTQQQFERIQTALTQAAEQLQQVQAPLTQTAQTFTHLLPDLHKQTVIANGNMMHIENISTALQQTVAQQTQSLDAFLAQQKLLSQQFDKHQKYNDGLTERLIETSKTLNYVASELQERTNLVQTAVIETAEVVTRLESSLQRNAKAQL